MKSKMIVIAILLAGLMLTTGGAAWAKNSMGHRQRPEVKKYHQRVERLQQRSEKWDRQARRDRHLKAARRHVRRHHYPPPAVKHHFRKHHRPRRLVYNHRHHHHRHHRDGFLFGWSMVEPGLAFSIVLGDRY